MYGDATSRMLTIPCTCIQNIVVKTGGETCMTVSYVVTIITCIHNAGYCSSAIDVFVLNRFSAATGGSCLLQNWLPSILEILQASDILVCHCESLYTPLGFKLFPPTYLI